MRLSKFKRLCNQSPQSSIRTSSTTTKNSLKLVCSQLPLTSTPNRRQPLVCFLTIVLRFSETSYKWNGFWLPLSMFLRSIHLAPRTKSSLLFTAEQDSIVSAFLATTNGVAMNFRLQVFVCVDTCVEMCSHVSSVNTQKWNS